MTHAFRPATDEELELVEHATRARARAYVPYSSFPVGAAARLGTGDIITGCNVENASFGLTLCAERTMLVRTVAEGGDPRTIETIAISVTGPNGAPCGACRQFIMEFAPTATVVFPLDGEMVAARAEELLPAAFMPESLNA